MSRQMSEGRIRKACQYIETRRSEYPVQTTCQVLEVAPGGYYEWLQNPISGRARLDTMLLRLIRASFVAGHGIYRWLGDPRDDPSGGHARCRSGGCTVSATSSNTESLGSGHAIRRRRMAPLLQIALSRTEHEPPRQLPG